LSKQRNFSRERDSAKFKDLPDHEVAPRDRNSRERGCTKVGIKERKKKKKKKEKEERKREGKNPRKALTSSNRVILMKERVNPGIDGNDSHARTRANTDRVLQKIFFVKYFFS
jgi:hypothetical protein